MLIAMLEQLPSSEKTNLTTNLEKKIIHNIDNSTGEDLQKNLDRITYLLDKKIISEEGTASLKNLKKVCLHLYKKIISRLQEKNLPIPNNIVQKCIENDGDLSFFIPLLPNNEHNQSFILKHIKFKQTKSEKLSFDEVKTVMEFLTEATFREDAAKSFFSQAADHDQREIFFLLEGFVSENFFSNLEAHPYSRTHTSDHLRQYLLEKIQQDNISISEKKKLIECCLIYFRNSNTFKDLNILTAALYLKFSDSSYHPHLEEEKFFTTDQSHQRDWYNRIWEYLLANHQSLDINLNHALADFAYAGNLERVKDLIRAGANLDGKNRHSETAFSAVVQKMQKTLEAGYTCYPRYLDLCHFLLDKDCALQAIPPDQTTDSSEKTINPDLQRLFSNLAENIVKFRPLVNPAMNLDQIESAWTTLFRRIIDKLETSNILSSNPNLLQAIIAACLSLPNLQETAIRLMESSEDDCLDFMQSEYIYSLDSRRLKKPIFELLESRNNSNKKTPLKQDIFACLHDHFFQGDQDAQNCLLETARLAHKVFTCHKGITHLMSALDRRATIADYERVLKDSKPTNWSDEEYVNAVDDDGNTAWSMAEKLALPDESLHWLTSKGAKNENHTQKKEPAQPDLNRAITGPVPKHKSNQPLEPPTIVPQATYSQKTNNWILASSAVTLAATTVSALTFAFVPSLASAFFAAGGTLSFVVMVLLATALAALIPLTIRSVQKKQSSFMKKKRPSFSDDKHPPTL